VWRRRERSACWAKHQDVACDNACGTRVRHMPGRCPCFIMYCNSSPIVMIKVPCPGVHCVLGVIARLQYQKECPQGDKARGQIPQLPDWQKPQKRLKCQSFSRDSMRVSFSRCNTHARFCVFAHEEKPPSVSPASQKRKKTDPSFSKEKRASQDSSPLPH